MSIAVVWHTLRPEVPATGYWDQQLVWELLHGRWAEVPDLPEFTHYEGLAELPGDTGAVVCLPGAAHADRVPELNEQLARLPWVLLIVGQDEGGTWPADQVEHPKLRQWVTAPRPGAAGDVYRLPMGPTPHAWLEPPPWRADPPLRWWYAGQVTNPHRDQAVRMLNLVDGGHATPTDGFAQGMNPAEYLHHLADAKVAPAPGGIVCADSFRAWEALHCGAVPLVDDRAGERDDRGYWHWVLGDNPLPLVTRWGPDVADTVADQVADWPAPANRVGAWYTGWRHSVAEQLVDDLQLLGVDRGRRATLADRVEVLMPTSPIPSHPDPDVLLQTLASVRAQLGNVRIHVMADGVRPEQAHLANAYHQALRQVLELAVNSPGWRNVVVHLHDEHQHQARMTRAALRHVRTPMVLFVEHDTPLVGEVPWDQALNVVGTRQLDVLRFYHDARIEPQHAHLMHGHSEPGLLPVQLTEQWSQRPHLARTPWYRRQLAEHFDPDERWMIEDRMHSVAQDPRWPGTIGIYEPEGNVQRSTHLDGRQNEPKWVDR